MQIFYYLALPVGFLWRHKRLAIMLIVVTVGFVVYNNRFKPDTPEVELADYQKNLPSQLQHLDTGITSTRIYYIAEYHYSEDGEFVYLDDFYAYDNEWERYNEISLPFRSSDIKIMIRQEIYKNG